MSKQPLAVTPSEKLDAVREWVETGIAKTLEEDPSGFLLGIESVSILQALDDIKSDEAAQRAVEAGNLLASYVAPARTLGAQAALDFWNEASAYLQTGHVRGAV